MKIAVGKGSEVEGFMSRAWNNNPYGSWPPRYVAFAAFGTEIQYKFCLPNEQKVLIVSGTNEIFKGEHLSNSEDYPSECLAPSLKRPRSFATLCNNLICGGNGKNTRRSCEKYDGIETSEVLPVRLMEPRFHHLCWGLQSGDVLLLGGKKSGSTTELVSADGTLSSANFELPYETM